ncbi:(2Fe-2S)-binding protein [Vibrio panuliri]|uniref:(2Fe-2S)-binding protein n=1 Tax=Vibrio panuliri TaxID=1381081 RepID=A0A1Q9HRE9_9VIBR|nr:YcbX family protein [Vibrio panuliri]OLQ93423.1 (2Fe-2S)-binding protein [Vibrio panuliri]
MTASTLSQINVYPVKSVGGVSLSNAWVEKQGLMFDRRFMLALADGVMVTARKYPHMVKVTSVLTPDGLIFSAPNQPPLKIRYADFKMQPTPAKVWGDAFEAYTTLDEADDWFSQVLGKRVELLFTGEQSQRVREKLGHNVSFADGYPLLLISQGSLDELNRRSRETHSMDQFRTNLVAASTEPFIEDSWKRIRIGEVEFEAVKPCERCILTTVDVESGKFRPSKEPLKTLSEFRANDAGGVFFGQNLVAKNEGLIRVGDEITVLEYKQKERYVERISESFSATSDTISAQKELKVCVNGQHFTADNQRSLLEQAEEVGINIPNSCRAGLCGACRVKVVDGEVNHPDVPAYEHIDAAGGEILACCAVPKTDIEVSY